MKNWIKRTLVALFGAGVLAGGLAACSHGRHHGGWDADASDHSEWHAKMVDRVGGKLDLNEAQKQKFASLVQKLHEQRQALVAGGADPRAEVQSLVAGSTFDKARAQKLIDEKIAAVQGKSPDVIAAMADFYDSLDLAQQQKVREFMQRGRGRHRHG
ncbi:MAG: Spy/CpxP family protein refolding chaperone [Burkholderiales bacterium]